MGVYAIGSPNKTCNEKSAPSYNTPTCDGGCHTTALIAAFVCELEAAMDLCVTCAPWLRRKSVHRDHKCPKMSIPIARHYKLNAWAFCDVVLSEFSHRGNAIGSASS